jgi:shikimate kinase
MTATFITSARASDSDFRKPHIVLVGLPGAGKTTVGAGLATQLGRAFLDFDREIEQRAGSTVADIFASRGEHYFREMEVALTLEARRCGDMVLAPGGGWITNKDVMSLLRPPGRIVYLKIRPEVALQRLGSQPTARPLLMRPDPLGELKRLLAAREPLYSQADFVVDAEALDLQGLIDNLAKLASTFGAG